MRQLRRDYVSDNFNQKRYNFVSKCCVIKGLRRVLEGLVVTMHEGLCEQYVKFDFLFTLTFVHFDNKPRHVLNNDYNMTFQYHSISPYECKYSPLKIRILGSKRELFRVLLPLLRHVMPFKYGNCRLIISVKGRCDRDALTGTINIKKSTKMKHIYNESANTIEGCHFAFRTDDCWNFR